MFFMLKKHEGKLVLFCSNKTTFPSRDRGRRTPRFPAGNSNNNNKRRRRRLLQQARARTKTSRILARSHFLHCVLKNNFYPSKTLVLCHARLQKSHNDNHSNSPRCQKCPALLSKKINASEISKSKNIWQKKEDPLPSKRQSRAAKSADDERLLGALHFVGDICLFLETDVPSNPSLFASSPSVLVPAASLEPRPDPASQLKSFPSRLSVFSPLFSFIQIN